MAQRLVSARTAIRSMERRERQSFWGFGGSPTRREMTVDDEEMLLFSSEVVSAASGSGSYHGWLRSSTTVRNHGMKARLRRES